jgi:GxxExxY protein
MMLLFHRRQIKAEQQKAIKVYYDGIIVSEYIADILVEEKIILELKSVENITNVHRAQVLNYLKATRLRLAIIINFGKHQLEYERIIL